MFVIFVKVNKRSEGWRNSRAIYRYLNTWELKSWLCIFACVRKTFSPFFLTVPAIARQYIDVLSIEFYFSGHQKSRPRLLNWYQSDLFEVSLLHLLSKNIDKSERARESVKTVKCLLNTSGGGRGRGGNESLKQIKRITSLHLITAVAFHIWFGIFGLV